MKRICMLAGRWALIVLLSVAIMLPPVWVITTWAVERAEAQYRATRPKLPSGQKDLDFGLRGLGALVAYTAGSFVVLWPLSLWASYRLFRNVGRTRRATEPAKAAVKLERPDLVVAHPLQLGESVPGADSPLPVQAALGAGRMTTESSAAISASTSDMTHRPV